MDTAGVDGMDGMDDGVRGGVLMEANLKRPSKPSTEVFEMFEVFEVFEVFEAFLPMDTRMDMFFVCDPFY